MIKLLVLLGVMLIPPSTGNRFAVIHVETGELLCLASEHQIAVHLGHGDYIAPQTYCPHGSGS